MYNMCGVRQIMAPLRVPLPTMEGLKKKTMSTYLHSLDSANK